mmetsp:Transcript_65842/g.123180  ORF Transcript_65842/g.123180 Transcript_65842/m.123180 type:complete len:378 (+) Transcript_65842:54-1187(+)
MYDNGEVDNNQVGVQLEEVQREIEGMELENATVSSWLKKNDDGSAQRAAQEIAAAAEKARIAAGGRRGAPKPPPPAKLTASQKVEVATAELDLKQREMDDERKAAEKLVDTLKAVLEETETRIAELKKDAYEFKRDIVVGGENPRTGRTVAEKVLKYMDDKLLSRDQMIDKLKLKNQTLKTQVARAEAETKAKAETGEMLHYIDFHQLQIENKQHLAKIDALNEDLLKLKESSGAAVASLNFHKKQLAALVADEVQATVDSQGRTDLLAKINADIEKVTSSLVTERKISKRLASDSAAAVATTSSSTSGGGGAGAGGAGGGASDGVPQVLDYVAQKAEMFDLQQVLKTWDRKLEIMEMAAKRAKQLKRQQRTTGFRG